MTDRIPEIAYSMHIRKHQSSCACTYEVLERVKWEVTKLFNVHNTVHRDSQKAHAVQRTLDVLRLELSSEVPWSTVPRSHTTQIFAARFNLRNKGIILTFRKTTHNSLDFVGKELNQYDWYYKLWVELIVSFFATNIDSRIKPCPTGAHTCAWPLFRFCDLDLNPMTLKLEGALDILKTYLHAESEVARLRHSKFPAKGGWDMHGK